MKKILIVLLAVVSLPLAAQTNSSVKDENGKKMPNTEVNVKIRCI